MEKPRYKILKFFVFVFFSLTLVYSVISFYKIVTTSAPDFGVYYQAAKDIILKINPYTDTALYTGYGYPPFSVFPFLPFLILSYGVSQFIWTLLNIVSFVGIFMLLRKIFPGEIRNIEFVFLITLAFWYFPFKFTLGMGQSTVVALFLLLIFLSDIKNKFIKTILLAFSLMLKPHFLLLLPVFILKNLRNTFALSIVYISVISIIINVYTGPELFLSYLKDMVIPLSEYSGREIYYNQGIGAFFARLFESNLASKLTLVSSIFIYFSGLICLKNYKNQYTQTALFLVILFLVEPLAWQHHMVILIPAYYFLYVKFKYNYKILILLVVSFVLTGLNIKNPLVFQKTWYHALILSHGFFGSLMLYILMLQINFKHQKRQY